MARNERWAADLVITIRQKPTSRFEIEPTHLLVEACGDLGTDARRERRVAECDFRAASLADLNARARECTDQPCDGVLGATLELGLGGQRAKGAGTIALTE